MMIPTRIVIAVLTTAVVATPIPAAADQGAIVGGVVAATAIESRTEMAIAGAVGYRVNRFLGFGVEITSVPVLKPDATALRAATIVDSLESAVATSFVGGPLVTAGDGRATVFTTNVRVEFPPIATRFLPYLIGGGGIANIKDNFTVTLPVPAQGIPVVIQPQAITQSSTSLALTAGGGASIQITGPVSIDVDLRYLRLLASRDLNVGRFGIGLSYRF